MTRALLTLVVVSNFQLRYDPAVLHEHRIKQLAKWTSQQNGTDVPVDVAPARVRIEFAGNGRDYPDTITFIPLRDLSVPSFAKAYPEVAASTKALRAILNQPLTVASKQLQAADLSCIDNGHAFYSHYKPVKFPWGDGVLFVTQYTQEEESNPPNNQELVVVFLGLTRTGSHYVRGEFALRHPALPATIRTAGPHKAMPAQIVDNLTPPSLQPGLDALEQVLASIQPAGRSSQ
jgi:hypothetical protein